MASNPFYKYLTKEQREHKRLVEWISKDSRTKKLLWWHTPNEGRKTAFERYLWSIMGGKKGVSDFIFIENNGKYNGLVIELKPEKKRVYKKNGDPYYPDQHDFLIQMKQQGFFSTFCCGSEKAKDYILGYLGYTHLPEPLLLQINQ